MTDLNSYLPWIILIVLLVLDFLMSAVKSSLLNARLPYLLNMRENRENAVDRTIKVIEQVRQRTNLRLVMVFLHMLLAGTLMLITAQHLPDASIWLNLFILTAFITVISILEYLIEAVVLKSAEETAIRLRFLAQLTNILFMPLAAILIKILGPNANRVTLASMTEEDLRNWVEVGQPEGSLEKGEREMIYSIFQFGDTLAKDIMIPRIDVLALDIQATLGEARTLFTDAGHSRVPVYEETVDNVVGLLYAKDLLSIRKDEDLIGDHRDMLRLAYFVPEAKKVDELLAEMQLRSMHMAIVVDEYGGVAGVVTLEDIVEEIIGEIRDEYDESEEMPFEKISDTEYIFLGRVDLDIFNEVMKTTISTENADTIGGFIYGEIGDVPEGGETISVDGITLTVDEVIGRRISKVRARRDEQPVAEEGVTNANG